MLKLGRNTTKNRLRQIFVYKKFYAPFSFVVKENAIYCVPLSIRVIPARELIP